jgi:hypothetical protein
MRRAARTDANQARIVERLRAMGASVTITSHVGNGFPDLLVGYMGRTYLFEIKDGDKPPSERKLTAAEAHFLEAWTGGPALVVEDEAQAVDALLGRRRS